MNTRSLMDNPLQRRVLAFFDDEHAPEDVTAQDLALQLGATARDVETALTTLVHLGNLSRQDDFQGEARYGAAPRSKLLGAMLVEAGVVTRAQLQEALGEQRETGERLGQILLARGHVTKEALGRVLEAQRGVPYVNLAGYPIDEGLVRALAASVILQHKVVPLRRVGRDVYLAMLDPTDVMAMDTVARLLGGRVRPYLITERDFDWAMSRFFDISAGIADLKAATGDAHDGASTAAEDPEESPAARLVAGLVQEADRAGATDIHIEPEGDRASIRFRVDGVLQERSVIPAGMVGPLVARLKALAGMDIVEHVRGQEGRFLLSLEGREHHLRIGTVAAVTGERVAVHLLNAGRVVPGLDRLGLTEAQQHLLQHLLRESRGLIVVAGPPGSGTTTTLYAALASLNDRTRNIMTVEDPVAHRLHGMAQIAVREQSGVSYASGLRSVLRQDPDVVMVGEIRDGETEALAIQAALTGRLVLTAMQAGDAAAGLVRLLDLGIEPYLLASSALAVMGQRAVRTLCRTCRKRYRERRQDDLGLLGLQPGGRAAVWRAVGCAECAGQGYRGRTAVFEILPVTERVRDLIMQRRPGPALMEAALAEGMVPLRAAAAQLVLDGVTTVDEMRRVVPGAHRPSTGPD